MPSIWENMFGTQHKKKKRSRPTTPKTPNPTDPKTRKTDKDTTDTVYHDADGNIVKKKMNKMRKKKSVPVPIYGSQRTYSQKQRRRRLMPTRFLYV